MKLFSIFSLLLFVSNLSYSQLSDSFSDGDFTNNPTWFGQDSLFIVNSSGELQLNDTNSVSNEAYLVSNTGALNVLDSLTWNFRINLLFNNPSTSNQPRFYLMSDNNNLNNSLNGYYIAIGETGALDKINLYRQDGSTSSLICSGINVHSSNINLKIRVIRDPVGNWLIESDTTVSGLNFVFESSGFDNNHQISSYSGVYCKYTSTRSTKFIFDDISLSGGIFLDTISPSVNSIGLLCFNGLQISFSEPVDLSADSTQNYTLLAGNTNPSLVFNENNNYQLYFNDNFIGGDTISIVFNNIKDLASNFLSDTVHFLIPDTSGNILLTDNFCDGDFTNNPNWYGDVDLFLINSSGSLQLSDTGILDGNAHLVSNTGILDFSDSLVWNFRLQLLFNNPSSGNQPRVYLSSDNDNLEGSLNGYYISIGESGQNDKIKLYRQDGLNSTEICSGFNTYSNNINLKIRVIRDLAGNWLIESDSSLTGNFIYEGGVTDDNHIFSMFSGVYFKYTSSYSQDYIFDDCFIIGNNIIDNTPPFVSLSKVAGPKLLNIYYNEPVNYLAEQTSSYYFNELNDYPLSVSNLGDGGYQLELNSPFDGSDTIMLSISSVEDLSFNVMNDTVYIIVPDTAEYGEVLFNEILFDPLTDGSEYVEIYNNSNKIFDLQNYQLAKLNEEKDSIVSYEPIEVSCLILPEELLLFTKYPEITAQDYFNSDRSRFVEMSNISKTYFTNGSETLYLLDPDSNIIDEFSYSEDMHFELIDDPSGVSLEKINPKGNSMDQMLWHSASENSNWGTPGLPNSQLFNSTLSTDIFRVETKVFSPDNDGFEDIAVFNYNLASFGYVGNLFIYDNLGRLIKVVLNNELLGNNGTATWDGANEQGQKAGVGIYLVYFEYFNATGEVNSFKKSITLKTRF